MVLPQATFLVSMATYRCMLFRTLCCWWCQRPTSRGNVKTEPVAHDNNTSWTLNLVTKLSSHFIPLIIVDTRRTKLWKTTTKWECFIMLNTCKEHTLPLSAFLLVFSCRLLHPTNSRKINNSWKLFQINLVLWLRREEKKWRVEHQF